jgi:prepilin-type N-terminal cleavage/methylation domain-containing protein
MVPRIRPTRGFSLMELLVSMTLMVVIASCLYGSLRGGFNARRVGLIAIEPGVVAMNVLEMMKQDFQGTVSPAAKLGGAFVGTDERTGEYDTDSISFYTTAVPATSSTASVVSSSTNRNTLGGSDSRLTTTKTPRIGGTAKVEFALVVNDRQSNYRLIRRVTTNLLSPKEEVEPEEQVLCRSVQALNFRFYDGNDWVDKWDSTTDANCLPLAVEIEIAIAYDDSRAAGAASLLSTSDRVSTVASSKTNKIRRLHESILIPCGGEPPVTTTTTEETDSSTEGTGDTGGTGGGGGGGGGGG